MFRLLMFTCLVLTFGLVQKSFSKVINYDPLKMSVLNGDSLSIRGFGGDIKFIVVPRSKEITIYLKQINSDKLSERMIELQEEWMFSIDKKGKVFDVNITGPASRKDWSKIVRSQAIPKFNIVIKGPSMPLKVSWWNGKVEVYKWKSPIQMTLLKGRVFVDEMVGDLRLQEQSGAIQVTNHVGSITIGTYGSKVTLTGVEGDVELENFSGDSHLSKIKGSIRFKGYKGALRLKDVEGDVEFESRQAGVSLVELKGAVKGRTAQGRVSLDLSGKVSVDIRSKEGAVSLRLKGSGASVNLGSKEGSIYAPSYLRSTQYATMKVKQGRLRGKEQGRVFVRTDSGLISLR